VLARFAKKRLRQPVFEGGAIRLRFPDQRVKRRTNHPQATKEIEMVGVIVTFQYDEGSFDRGRIEGVAERARPSFSGLPGLRLKAFTVDEENYRAVNVYLWDDDDAAASFFGDELRERVTGLYGVAPRIDFVQVAALVENTGTPIAP
jgi:hypothetical protein